MESEPELLRPLVDDAALTVLTTRGQYPSLLTDIVPMPPRLRRRRTDLRQRGFLQFNRRDGWQTTTRGDLLLAIVEHLDEEPGRWVIIREVTPGRSRTGTIVPQETHQSGSLLRAAVLWLVIDEKPVGPQAGQVIADVATATELRRRADGSIVATFGRERQLTFARAGSSLAAGLMHRLEG